MERAPLVSVVLPVRNGERFVAEAIDSIRGQTLADFELLVVENGSTDETVHLVEQLADVDSRIRLLTLGPVGLVGALNAGLELARGRFVARMDADDVSGPDRLGLQLRELERCPDLVAVASGYRFVDVDGRTTGQRRMPRSPRAFAAALHFGNPIAHASVMFAPERLEAELSYREDRLGAEDLDLWLRLTRTQRVGVVPAVLLDHRTHSSSVTSMPTTGRRSAVEALNDVAPWPLWVARWVHSRTFEANQAGVRVVEFIMAVIVLNTLNLVRPMSARRALLGRSFLAVGSVLRRRIRDRRRLTR